MPTDVRNETGATPTNTLRFDQTFPSLTAQEIDRLRRFGSEHRFSNHEPLFETGKPGPGMFVVLSGHVAITQRDGLGHVTPVVDQGPGQFLAEVGQLSGRPALVDGIAEGDVDALVIPPEGLRRLLVAEAELGERIMRALILRRVALIERGAGGPVLIGSAHDDGLVALQGFLTRNGFPYHLLDPKTDVEAGELISRYAPKPNDMPLVIAPDGTVMRNPAQSELATALGMLNRAGAETIYDVAIVGAGPAGLATAVYGASEGLSVIVLDARAYGGQAGASARIENYLGFPTGISGQALAGRAFAQAQKFGAEILVPAEVKQLRCGPPDGIFALELAAGGTVRAKAIVVASGAKYRRPAIENLAAFEGRGVWYWASPIEARLCANEEVVLVGGGNSAGQAAVFLSAHASRVTMMIRGDGLAASMSRYLIDRIEAAQNIVLKTQAEITALEGDAIGGLSRIRWWNRRDQAEQVIDAQNVFLFVGADPATAWLADCGVALDKAGFILTGATGPLESSVRGVFAVGDVRSSSIKRVGASIGEGAQVVAALHLYLAESTPEGA